MSPPATWRDRLFKEVETNVAMRVEETDSADTFKVSGRGELHLSILIEQMRRQNYEFQVSRPSVIFKEENGKKLEPMELLMIEVPDNYVGAVMEKLGTRKAELLNMGTRDSGTTHLEFKIPSRGIMGYRSEFLTDTNGNGIMNHVFDCYEPYKGDIQQRSTGSLVVHETGESTAYGLFYAQDRGRLFIGPGVPVYEGMIVGSNPKGDDIVINVCKKKHADKHPRFRLRRRTEADPAHRALSGAVPRVHRGRRACGDHAEEHPHAQNGAEQRAAHEASCEKEVIYKPDQRKRHMESQ